MSFKNPELQFVKYQVALNFCKKGWCQINEYSFVQNLNTGEAKIKLTGIRELIPSQLIEPEMEDATVKIYPFYSGKKREL